MSQFRVYSRTFSQTSAFTAGGPGVILAALVLVLEQVLSALDVLQIPKPWNGVIALVLGCVLSILRLLQSQSQNPSVSASSLPSEVEVLKP